MIRRSFAVVLLLSAAAFADPTTLPGGVAVSGEVATPLTLSAADLAAMPRKTLHVKDHGGRDATYEGVALRDVLVKAGVPLGQKRMRGPLVGQALVVTAADGYRATFGLAEVDSDYAERDILLADRRDGVTLDAKEGPFRLVVPQETMQGRWVRMVAALKVVSVK